MTTIIGVDFSGAEEDRNTWITLGHLNDNGKLLLDVVHPIRRADLYDLLSTIPTPAVVALDFPFGVPGKFAAHLCGNNPPADMPDLWDAVAGMDADQFSDARNQFVADHGEPTRAGDARHFPESYSPLHRVNPNMLPMTYQGITLLHRWHQNHPQRWHVPPLEPTAQPEETVTLLELMPGAFLRSLDLPYNGYKRGANALQLRERILTGLSAASRVRLPNLHTVRMGCRANDDCLDAVVAATAAAAWAQDAQRFRHPTAGELAEARLEGWIYVPALPPSPQRPH